MSVQEAFPDFSMPFEMAQAPRQIIGMDGEQRLAFFDGIADFMMDDDADSVVNRIALFSSTCTERHCRLAYDAGVDLGQVPASRSFYYLDDRRLRQFNRIVHIGHIPALRRDQRAEFFECRPLVQGLYRKGAAWRHV